MLEGVVQNILTMFKSTHPQIIYQVDL